jgi:hypothetical protein
MLSSQEEDRLVGPGSLLEGREARASAGGKLPERPREWPSARPARPRRCSVEIELERDVVLL